MAPCRRGSLLIVFLAAAGSLGAAAPLLTRVRPIERETALMSGARPPAVLMPADPGYRDAAALLVRGLAAEKIAAEEASDVAAADPSARTVICVGTMLNNPLLERLYWNRYTYVDAVTPAGPAGAASNGQYLLQTVYDPYPYNGGHNVIVIGCHDPAGAARGIRRFLALVKGGRLPYVLEVGPKSPVTEAEARAIGAAPPAPTLTELSDNTERYLKTGAEAYARKAVAAMDIMAKMYAPGGERQGAKPSFYARLPWNEETHSSQIACAWDDLEECPLLSDAQRLEDSNVLLQFTRDLVGHVSGYADIIRDDTISWNHTTHPMLGINFGARYFERYYHLPDMPEMLAKARACFLGQARSWKPKEDADTYMSSTMLHTAIYCLADNQMGYFTSGNMRRYADYVVAIGDNLGRASGFGDSNSLATDPRLAETVLPLALWWTRDGGYRWLMDRYSGGHWVNPYARGVAPIRPDRLTGVQVFHLDKQLYAYTQARPFYSETVVPADVPPDEAFDKVAFRENWDVGGQYLLVDGFARGKHLHYDGNSIVEFVEGGERWLIDHDYYIQSTTEHTMLSILRDGRCAELEPSMSGLAAEADLPAFGFTRTYVRKYNGCDWQRQILWRKGGWFLVADTVTPKRDGEYAFDLTWKTIDSGHDRVDAGGDFVSERGIAPEDSRNFSVVDDALAPGGKSLQLDNLTSQVAFGLDLPSGAYSLRLIGDNEDPNTGNEHGDFLRVSVDGGTSQWFRLTDGTGPVPSPRIALAGNRTHLVVAATSNVHAPMRVQRLVFTDAAGKSFPYDATKLPPAPVPGPGNERRFWIKPCVAVASWTTSHHPEGIAVPVTILHQRQAGDFQAGQHVRFASLVFVNRPGARRELQPQRLAPNLVAVAGTDPAIALLGSVDDRGIHAEAEAGILTPESLAFCGLREFRADALAISSSAPVDLQWDAASGHATVEVSAAGADLSAAMGGAPQSFHLEAGRHDLALGRCPLPSLAALWAPGAGGTPAAGLAAAGEPPRKPMEPGKEGLAWVVPSLPGRVAGVKVADLADGQGPRAFVWGGHWLECLSAAGRRLWTFRAAGRPSDVAFGELRPSPGREIVVGASDTFVYLLAADGRLLEKRQMRGAPWNRDFGDLGYCVYGVAVRDLRVDGRDDIVVSLGNSELKAFDARWRPLWTAKDCTMQGGTQLSVEDLDGAGRPEAIVAADKYGYCEAVDFRGTEIYRGRNTIGDARFTVAGGSGAKPFIVTASSGGDLMATGTRGWWGAAGGVDMSESKLKQHLGARWRFDNYGYAITRLLAADLNGDGRTEILIASASGYVYAVDEAGKLLWKDRAGQGVNDVIVVGPAGKKSVVICDETGSVTVADATGRRIGGWRLPAAARFLAVLPTPQGPELVTVLADGRVAAYRL